MSNNILICDMCIANNYLTQYQKIPLEKEATVAVAFYKIQGVNLFEKRCQYHRPSKASFKKNGYRALWKQISKEEYLVYQLLCE